MNLSSRMWCPLLAAVLAAGTVRAQLASRPTLTLEAARQIASAAVVEARSDGRGGAIAVVDAGGALVYFERLDGTFPAASLVSFDKAHTAATFQHATKDFEDAVAKGRVALTGVKEMTPLEGGVPLVVDGTVVGAIGVSGAASAARDEVIARAGAAAAMQLRREPTRVPAVVVAPTAEVRASFARGAVLLDQHDYQVHTSRRDGPGKAEIHQLDTDIFYVLEGTATLVTGGKVPDAAPIGPNELRGSRIEGGESKTIAQGDVVVVPHGTPHWFREVKGPMLYFAVKVQNDGVAP
jgi:uncharacterized protein GlcG (DUF336 family)/mannose-6-phosphate isomerase-like protein (cupin superfamily)